MCQKLRGKVAAAFDSAGLSHGPNTERVEEVVRHAVYWRTFSNAPISVVSHATKGMAEKRNRRRISRRQGRPQQPTSAQKMVPPSGLSGFPDFIGPTTRIAKFSFKGAFLRIDAYVRFG